MAQLFIDTGLLPTPPPTVTHTSELHARFSAIHDSFEKAIYKIKNANFDLIAGKSGSGIFSSLDQNKLIFLKKEIIKNSKFYDYVNINTVKVIKALVT